MNFCSAAPIVVHFTQLVPCRLCRFFILPFAPSAGNILLYMYVPKYCPFSIFSICSIGDPALIILVFLLHFLYLQRRWFCFNCIVPFLSTRRIGEPALTFVLVHFSPYAALAILLSHYWYSFPLICSIGHPALVLLVHFSLFASLAILLSLYWSVYLYLQHWPSCPRVIGPFLSICIIGDPALIVLVRLSLFAALAILLSC